MMYALGIATDISSDDVVSDLFCRLKRAVVPFF